MREQVVCGLDKNDEPFVLISSGNFATEEMVARTVDKWVLNEMPNYFVVEFELVAEGETKTHHISWITVRPLTPEDNINVVYLHGDSFYIITAVDGVPVPVSIPNMLVLATKPDDKGEQIAMVNGSRFLYETFVEDQDGNIVAHTLGYTGW